MTDTYADAADGKVASWYRQPYVGIIALLTAMASIAMGHTILVLMRYLLDAREQFQPAEIIISLGMGAVGMWMTWYGRNKGEAVGTWLGFIAGNLIWIGWFELSWKAFAHMLNPAPVQYEGVNILNAELQVMQASSLILVMALVFLMLNKETRCNMLVWFRRKLGLDPGKALTNRERNFAAVTASQSYMTTWACYIITIMMVDPRIVGNPYGMAAQLPYVGLFGLGIYLIYRITLQRQMASALRYSIGAANINWIWVEAGSRARLYEEFWIKPLKYPISMALVFILMSLALVVMFQNKGPNRGTPAAA